VGLKRPVFGGGNNQLNGRFALALQLDILHHDAPDVLRIGHGLKLASEQIDLHTFLIIVDGRKDKSLSGIRIFFDNRKKFPVRDLDPHHRSHAQLLFQSTRPRRRYQPCSF
jgi:hypothetical protein